MQIESMQLFAMKNMYNYNQLLYMKVSFPIVDAEVCKLFVLNIGMAITDTSNLRDQANNTYVHFKLQLHCFLIHWQRN